MLHLICICGGQDKEQFLEKTNLWFYNKTLHQCTGQTPILKWRNFFTNSNNSNIFISLFKATTRKFPSIYSNKNISEYPIIKEIMDWAKPNN